MTVLFLHANNATYFQKSVPKIAGFLFLNMMNIWCTTIKIIFFPITPSSAAKCFSEISIPRIFLTKYFILKTELKHFYDFKLNFWLKLFYDFKLDFLVENFLRFQIKFLIENFLWFSIEFLIGTFFMISNWIFCHLKNECTWLNCLELYVVCVVGDARSLLYRRLSKSSQVFLSYCSKHRWRWSVQSVMTSTWAAWSICTRTSPSTRRTLTWHNNIL